MSEDLWHSARETWQALSPDVQLLLRAVGVFAATFVVGRAVGWQVARRLRAAHFDAAFRRPWSQPPAGRPDPHAPTPTRLVTGLVRLTVWGGGLWALAYLSGWTDLTRRLEWVGGRVWALVAVVLAALFLSRLFTERLVEAVQASPLRQSSTGGSPRPPGGTPGSAGRPWWRVYWPTWWWSCSPCWSPPTCRD